MNLLIFLVPAIAVVILFISLAARKLEWFVDFLTRLCIGGLAIYITSVIMLRLSLPCSIGVNSTTLSVVGLLGIPGFFLVLSVEVLNSIK